MPTEMLSTGEENRKMSYLNVEKDLGLCFRKNLIIAEHDFTYRLLDFVVLIMNTQIICRSRICCLGQFGSLQIY